MSRDEPNINFVTHEQPMTSVGSYSLETEDPLDDKEQMPIDIHVTPPTPAVSPGGTTRHQSTELSEMFGAILGLVIKKEEHTPFAQIDISNIVNQLKMLEEPGSRARRPFPSPMPSQSRRNRHLLQVPQVRRGRVTNTFVPSRNEPTATITRPPTDEPNMLETQSFSNDLSTD